MSLVQEGQPASVLLLTTNPVNLNDGTSYRRIAPRPPVTDVIQEAIQTAQRKRTRTTTKRKTCTCRICGCPFTHSSSMYVHMRRVHKTVSRAMQNGGQVKCREEGCNQAFFSIKLLRQHLHEKHCMQFSIETLLFQTYAAFALWKTEMELRTKSSFLRVRGARSTAEGRVEKYMCNRSGFGPHQRKTRASFKIGGHCTATLTVHIYNNHSVVVDACHTHYGHEMDLKYARLRTRALEEMGVSQVVKTITQGEVAALAKRKGQLALMLRKVGKKSKRDELAGKRETLDLMLKEIQQKITRLDDAYVLDKAILDFTACLQWIDSYFDGVENGALCATTKTQKKKQKVVVEQAACTVNNTLLDLCKEIRNEHFYATQCIDSVVEIEDI